MTLFEASESDVKYCKMMRRAGRESRHGEHLLVLEGRGSTNVAFQRLLIKRVMRETLVWS